MGPVSSLRSNEDFKHLYIYMEKENPQLTCLLIRLKIQPVHVYSIHLIFVGQ